MEKQCNKCDKRTEINADLSKHIVNVQEEHTRFLKGFKTIVKAKPDGACLFNCTAVHMHGDESRALVIRKAVNSHIHKNWNFYKDKVALPYTENIITKQGTKTI